MMIGAEIAAIALWYNADDPSYNVERSCVAYDFAARADALTAWRPVTARP